MPNLLQKQASDLMKRRRSASRFFKCFLSPVMLAVRNCTHKRITSESCIGTLANEIPLKFGQCSHQVKNELAAWSGRIDLLS